MPGIEVLFMGNNFPRLLGGLWVTIRISLISIGFSLILGTLLGAVMTSKNPVVKAVCRVYLEIVRIMPQLVWLFIVFFGVTKLTGVNLGGETSAVIVFTIWGAAEMGDLVRGAFLAIPRHQFESSLSMGLSKAQMYVFVIFPQAIRGLVPNVINLSTRMIKTTALVSLIGVTEVLKVGKQIIDANRFEYPNAALWVYAAIFFMYFAICFPLSMAARALTKKQQGGE
ncbi:MAG: amino acid ABC transporter permease [Lachnospiraceae bacterium]|nr:amino acid ABC transporter permease [Ruminococcus sp.]MCM1275676.1 amino acid ABC transporter permease [Lachnospiraceae bacterium]